MIESDNDVTIPLRFVGPNKEELPLDRYMAVPRPQFKCLMDIAHFATEAWPIYQKLQSPQLRGSENVLNACRVAEELFDAMQNLGKGVEELARIGGLPRLPDPNTGDVPEE